MTRVMADCRRFPSESQCSLTILGEEDEVVRAAAEHAQSVHGHRDGPELREQIRGMLEAEDTLPDGDDPLPGDHAGVDPTTHRARAPVVDTPRARAPARRRHPVAALPRLLRAARLDQGRRRPARQRPPGNREPPAPGGRGAPPAGRGALLRRRGGDLPHRRLRGLPRRPSPDAGRPAPPVAPGARLLRRLRLEPPRRGRRSRPTTSSGRSPAASATRAARRCSSPATATCSSASTSGSRCCGPPGRGARS